MTKKISELLSSAPAAVLDGTEGLEMTQSGGSVGALASQIRDYVDDNLPARTSTAQAVADLAALKALTTRPEVVTVKTGQAAGQWQWVSGSSTTADDGLVVQCTSGAAGRYKRIYDRDINARWFAAGDASTDDTTGLNAALTAALAIGCGVYFPAGTYRISAPLQNPGVSVRGEGLSSVIAPLSGLTNSESFMIYKPAANADLSFKEICGLTIFPNYDGTVRGKYALEFDFTNSGVFSARLNVHDNFLLPGNDFSVYCNNTVSNGNPYIARFERNVCRSGMKFIGLGDSVVIGENYISNDAGVGLDIDQIDGASGPAALVTIEKNNGAATAGWLKFRAGVAVKVLNNNVEQYAGAGSNGACIDIDGSDNSHADAPRVPLPEIRGNKVGMFDADGGNPTTATTAIRINDCTGAVIDGNYLIAGRAFDQAINITSSARETIIGDGNVFAIPDSASNWTANWTDAGTNTVSPKYNTTTPTPTAGSGSFTTVSCSLNVRRAKAEIFVDGEVVITTNGTAAGHIAVPMPFTPPRRVVFSAREMDATGAACAASMLPGGGAVLYIFAIDGTYPGGDGRRIAFSGRVPIA